MSTSKDELEGEKEANVSDNTKDSVSVSLSERNNTPQSPKSKSFANGELQSEENVNFSFTLSQDKLPCCVKRNRKPFKKEGSFDIITKLVVDSFISQMKEDTQTNQKLYQIYPNPDELCNECRWLVKATKSSDSLKSSSEDEEFVSKWIESRKCLRNCKENKSKEATELEYGKDDVLALLSEIHTSLLECNILMTTQKLQKEVRKSETARKEEKVVSETSINEEWFDEIQEDSDPKDIASKLGFILERFVSKYLKSSLK